MASKRGGAAARGAADRHLEPLRRDIPRRCRCDEVAHETAAQGHQEQLAAHRPAIVAALAAGRSTSTRCSRTRPSEVGVVSICTTVATSSATAVPPGSDGRACRDRKAGRPICWMIPAAPEIREGVPVPRLVAMVT